jgi:hypothetical protein
MTKSKKILQLLEKGLNPKQIAARVGCRPEYVRAVRGRAERPEVERNWKKKNREKLRERARVYQFERYQSDPEYAERRRAAVRKSQNKRKRLARALA